MERKHELDEAKRGVVYKNNFRAQALQYFTAFNVFEVGIVVEKLKHGKNLWQNVRQNCENFYL